MMKFLSFQKFIKEKINNEKTMCKNRGMKKLNRIKYLKELLKLSKIEI